MYRQHAAPKTQNERTSLFIRDAKRLTCARIAAFGVSALMAGQLLLPSAALAAETPETAAGQDAAAMVVAGPVASGAEKQATKTQTAAVDAASLTTMDAESAAIPSAVTEAAPVATTVVLADESAGTPASTPESVATASVPAAAPTSRGASDVPGGGGFTIDTTVVNHYYDLELPPAFTLIQGETFVYDFPDAPEDFTLRRNESVHFFRIDPDIESLVKTENPKEANVSISLAAIDNHERATLVFTGGGADPLISYSLDLLHLICIGALADFDFSNYNNGEGTILETRHEYFIRCVFGSNVYLIATDTTDPEPDPDVKPDLEIKTEFAPQSEAENPVTDSVSAKTAAVVEPAKTALPATGDSDAMAVALGAAGTAAAAAAAGVAAVRRRNR